jgi:hypothetical protein
MSSKKVHYDACPFGHSNIQNTVVYTFPTARSRDGAARKVFLNLPRYRSNSDDLVMDTLTRDPASPGDGGWHLTPADHALVAAKSRANRLRFAVMLLFFRDRGRFPRGADLLDPQAIASQHPPHLSPPERTKWVSITGASAMRAIG